MRATDQGPGGHPFANTNPSLQRYYGISPTNSSIWSSSSVIKSGWRHTYLKERDLPLPGRRDAVSRALWAGAMGQEG